MVGNNFRKLQESQNRETFKYFFVKLSTVLAIFNVMFASIHAAITIKMIEIEARVRYSLMSS